MTSSILLEAAIDFKLRLHLISLPPPFEMPPVGDEQLHRVCSIVLLRERSSSALTASPPLDPATNPDTARHCESSAKYGEGTDTRIRECKETTGTDDKAARRRSRPSAVLARGGQDVSLLSRLVVRDEETDLSLFPLLWARRFVMQDRTEVQSTLQAKQKEIESEISVLVKKKKVKSLLFLASPRYSIYSLALFLSP